MLLVTGVVGYWCSWLLVYMVSGVRDYWHSLLLNGSSKFSQCKADF